MLKRLFISLIILSTLASEGVMNFPGNIYSLISNTNNQLSLYGTEQDNSESAQSSVKAAGYTNEAFTLTYESLLKLNAGGNPRFDSQGSPQQFENYSVNFYINDEESLSAQTSILTDKSCILNQSDSSPPFLSALA